MFAYMVYWYVYILMDDATPFYVGITRHPSFRYQQHCCRSQWSTAYNHIYWMLKAGKTPNMVIVGHQEGRQGANADAAALNAYFAAIGVKLCNKDYNPYYNIRITCIPDGILPRRKQGYSKFIDSQLNEYLKKNKGLKYAGSGYCIIP